MKNLRNEMTTYFLNMKHFNNQSYTFLFKLQRCHTKSHMQQAINNRFPEKYGVLQSSMKCPGPNSNGI